MMYKPIHPCKDCKIRGVDACLECEPWKEYKAKMLEYYEAERQRKSVLSASSERRERIQLDLWRKRKR